MMNNLTRAMWVGAVLAGLCGWARAGEQDWPRFRGPNGSGVCNAPGIPAQWTDKDYNWKIKLPGVGNSSPVIINGRIFITSGDPDSAQRFVLCIDPASGKTLWQRDYPSTKFMQNRDNSFASATPAADADGVIVTWSTPDNVMLLALDNAGHDVWRRDLGPFVGNHGSGASPIILDDMVILPNDQEDPVTAGRVKAGQPTAAGKSFLLCVDRKTGKTRWQLDRRSNLATYITPCVFKPEAGSALIIVSSRAQGISAVDPASGKLVWELGDVFTQRCIGSPVTAGDLIIAGDGMGGVGAHCLIVKVAKDGKTAAVANQIKKPVPLVPTAVLKDGLLFLWGDDGKISCSRAATGETVWRDRVEGLFYASPVCINDRLYGVTRTGDVVVVSASEKFQLLGRVPLGEKSYASPAVADGVLYLRTMSQLFSIGGKK